MTSCHFNNNCVCTKFEVKCLESFMDLSCLFSVRSHITSNVIKSHHFWVGTSRYIHSNIWQEAVAFLNSLHLWTYSSNLLSFSWNLVDPKCSANITEKLVLKYICNLFHLLLKNVFIAMFIGVMLSLYKEFVVVWPCINSAIDVCSLVIETCWMNIGLIGLVC